jgi:hypothetical protein
VQCFCIATNSKCHSCGMHQVTLMPFATLSARIHCAGCCGCSWTGLWEAVEGLPQEQQYVLMCLPVIGQRHILMMPPAGEPSSST